MTPTWVLFYGHQIGMSRREIEDCRHGEMLDLISCYAIANGSAEEVRGHVTDYDDAMSLR